jgi:hypothetical protein
MTEERTSDAGGAIIASMTSAAQAFVQLEGSDDADIAAMGEVVTSLQAIGATEQAEPGDTSAASPNEFSSGVAGALGGS